MLAENVAHNLCCQIRADDNSSTCTFTTEKAITFTGACVNGIIPSINRFLSTKREKDVMLEYTYKPLTMTGVGVKTFSVSIIFYDMFFRTLLIVQS